MQATLAGPETRPGLPGIRRRRQDSSTAELEPVCPHWVESSVCVHTRREQSSVSVRTVASCAYLCAKVRVCSSGQVGGLGFGRLLLLLLSLEADVTPNQDS